MGKLLHAESLQQRHFLRFPSVAAGFAEVSDLDELAGVLAAGRESGLQSLPLGAGSNVVLRQSLPFLVIRWLENAIDAQPQADGSVLVSAGGGADWHALVQWCLERGFHGLENLALIPGTVGAAPVQNIGAYGVELQEFVEAVEGVMLETGERFVFSGSECEFRYRDSVFRNRLRDCCLITRVRLRLNSGATPKLDYPGLRERLPDVPVESIGPADVFAAVIALRTEKLPDPIATPNVGSFFKNPVVSQAQLQRLRREWPALPAFAVDDESSKLPAAWLIEKAGWKGRREGSVGVHPGHALVLVHYGGGTAEQLLELAGQIADTVRDRFDVALELEPRVYGNAA